MTNQTAAINEDITITDGDINAMNAALDKKQIVLAAIELGANVQKSVDTGWSEYFKAHVQVKEAAKTGICFCGKPATHLIYFWR